MPVAEKHQGDWKRPEMRGWRGRATALGVPAALFLVLVLFYWKITLTNQYTWLDSPDFAYQVLPWYQFQAGEWHKGKFPLWDPYVWAGQPLIGQAQPGVVYPPNWLLFLAPLKNGWIRQAALHWYLLFIHYMAALFCYWLCRDLGRSRGASVLAGLGFSVSGWLGNTEWPQMMNGAVWAPLVLLFLLRAIRGERPFPNAALSGAFLGVAFLSGHHQIPIFITLVCAGLWIYGFAREGHFRRELLLPAAVFGVLMVMVSAMQTLPAYEYGKLAVRWVGSENPVGWKQPVPYSVHAEYGLYPLSLLGTVIHGFVRHADPFIGVVLLSLAIIALGAAWREWHVRVFGAVALFGLIYSLGRHGLIEGILYAVIPMVEKARNPSMAIFIFHFGVVVLSAYGIDSYLLDATWPERLRRVLVWFGAVLFGLVALASFTMQKPPFDYDPVALAAFAALLLAAAFNGWHRGAISRRTAVVLLTGLMLMEASAAGTSFRWRHREQPGSMLKKLSEHGDIADFLRQQNVPVRVEMDGDAMPYNFGDWYGIDVLGGYLASMTSNILNIQHLYGARMLLGTNFHVGAKPSRPNQVQVFESASGLKVYANPEAFPRAWSVHEAVKVQSAGEIGPHLDKDPVASLRSRVYLVGDAPPVEQCAGADEVRLVERATNRVVIEANMRCRGMVLAGEPFYPGWRATVDGKPARIYEAYGFMRGVPVEAGRHRIEMRYRPRSVFLGAALTAAGLVCTFLVAVLGFSRRRVI